MVPGTAGSVRRNARASSRLHAPQVRPEVQHHLQLPAERGASRGAGGGGRAEHGGEGRGGAHGISGSHRFRASAEKILRIYLQDARSNFYIPESVQRLHRCFQQITVLLQTET